MLTFIYLVIIEDDDATKDIKTTLKQILERQQSMMKRLETVESAIKGWYAGFLSGFWSRGVEMQCNGLLGGGKVVLSSSKQSI